MGKKNYECVSLISTNNNSFITFREERQNNLDYFLSRSLARCRYQQKGAQDYSEVVFECPPPGLAGNIVTVQSLADRIYVLEIQILGK